MKLIINLEMQVLEYRLGKSGSLNKNIPKKL
jgi:hypothetical protein